MRITRIDFEGREGYYASAVRRRDSMTIVITLVTPDFPDGQEYEADANNQDELFRVAASLQSHLDGCRGTNSMIHDYYRELQRLA